MSTRKIAKFGAVVCGAGVLALSACGSQTGQSSQDQSSGAKQFGSTLKLGYLVPETGSSAALGSSAEAGVLLAQKEINASGGVNGNKVEFVRGDEGDTDGVIAAQTVGKMLNQNVSAIVGAFSSATSLSVIDKITGAGVLQCGATNSTPTLTDYPDKDLFFRLIASDVAGGRALAQLAVQDGHSKVGVIMRSDDWGKNMADQTVDSLNEVGADVVEVVKYDPSSGDFGADVSKLAAAGPDAIIIGGFDEGTRVIQAMIKQGIGPSDVPLYVAPGAPVASWIAEVDPKDAGALAGMRVLDPSGPDNAEFDTEASGAAKNVIVPSISRYYYDCVNLIALSAEAAKSNDPGEFASKMIPLSGGQGSQGEKCQTFDACKTLLGKGETINYEGVSGPLDLDDKGEPTKATFLVSTIDKAGKPVPGQKLEGTSN